MHHSTPLAFGNWGGRDRFRDGISASKNGISKDMLMLR